MNLENTPWTTYLGKVSQELQQNQAPEQHVRRIEDELIQAIQCVRHVRRCYEKCSATVTHE